MQLHIMCTGAADMGGKYRSRLGRVELTCAMKAGVIFVLNKSVAFGRGRFLPWHR
jgi:hypothetical protein